MNLAGSKVSNPETKRPAQVERKTPTRNPIRPEDAQNLALVRFPAYTKLVTRTHVKQIAEFLVSH